MRKIIRHKSILLDGNNNPTIIDNNFIANKKIKKRQNKVKTKRSKGNKKRAVTANRLNDLADSLERNLPRSEAWFRAKYELEPNAKIFKSARYKDQYNKPFRDTFIPDILNEGYKYIIEVDGSVHDSPEAVLRDQKRDYYFLKRGYLVIRVKAYDEESYRACMVKLYEHINKINSRFLEEQSNRNKRCNWK